MTATTPFPLEPAEFYLLYDGRGEWEFIFNLNQIEACPEQTPPYSATVFEAPCPHALAHIDAVISQSAEGQLTVYDDIVSAEWKAAIESVEPGVHQFVPHELRFTGAVVSDRYIFRCQTRLNAARLYYHVEEVCDAWGDAVGYRFAVNEDLRVPELDRAQAAGRHVVSGPDNVGRFVSRALAEKLHPLLPERTALLPVKLSGEAPLGAPSVPATVADDVRQGAADMPTSGQPAPGRGRSSEPPAPSSRLDPELAAAIGVFSNPTASLPHRNRAEALLQSRLEAAPVELIFVIMAEALKFDGPLLYNFVFSATYCACYDRDERELLPPCRTWAADPSPLRRIAAARMLARPIPRNERPNPETFAILTGLLDDPDPNVVNETLCILFWMFHPAYTEALQSRRDQFAHHDSAKVRDSCRALIGREPETEIGSYRPSA